MPMASPAYRRLASAFVVYTVAVVLWGALVRATLSGDGCGDHWPLCDGEVIPVAPSAKKLVELTHRITSGVAWIGALAFWVSARRRFERGLPIRRAAFWGFFFMTTEALVGAGLVVFRMVADNPDTARGYWMALHLVNTFVLLAVLTLHAYFAYGGRPFRARGRAGTGFVGIGLGLLAVGVTGAIAALGDTLFPVGSLAEGIAQDLDPEAHVFLRLRVAHPVVALVVSAAVLLRASALAATADAPRIRQLAIVVALATVAQVGLGFLNVALLAPVWLQLVHLAVADGIWIAWTLLAARALALQGEPARAADEGKSSEGNAAVA
ncbi:MAG: COX15/CtaA family protein [Myxococcales bacterium]|nr:COX15/CtaA family protein [Myxococcales bacterium]